jgi:hypothetical protein
LQAALRNKVLRNKAIAAAKLLQVQGNPDGRYYLESSSKSWYPCQP